MEKNMKLVKFKNQYAKKMFFNNQTYLFLVTGGGVYG